MTANYIDGKAIAARVRAKAREDAATLSRAPALAVVLVGENPASRVYVRNKVKACQEAGIISVQKCLDAGTSEEELLRLIGELNRDPAVDGILVQLPLPAQIDEKRVLEAIDPDKDVDGFHVVNVGRFMTGIDAFTPCTPTGVMELIESTGVKLKGLHAVVVGRSNIVGKPMALMLLNHDCTVTIAHSKTRDLAAITRQADVLVVAVGRARFITAGMVKPGAIVIDVGINRNEEGKLCGDVDTAQVAEVASWITPVPGGVGPMTIAELLRNTVLSSQKRQQKA